MPASNTAWSCPVTHKCIPLVWVNAATSFKHCAAAVVTTSTQMFETNCRLSVNQSNVLTATQKHSNRWIPLLNYPVIIMRNYWTDTPDIPKANASHVLPWHKGLMETIQSSIPVSSYTTSPWPKTLELMDLTWENSFLSTHKNLNNSFYLN